MAENRQDADEILVLLKLVNSLVKGKITDTTEIEQALESLQNKRAELGLPQEPMSFKALHALRQKRMAK